MDNDLTMPYSLQIPALGVESVPLEGNDDPNAAPCFSVFLADGGQTPTPAVVICPGGGYGFLANDHEGCQVARWFNQRGISAFVLHYRLGPLHNYPTQLIEAQTALSTVRQRAGQWRIDPGKVGIMGFSAGGHLAASASTLGTDTPEHTPDFSILGYPVITMKTPYTHEGSRDNLMGSDKSPELIERLSLELQVTHVTPPTFIFHTTDDNAVPVENAVMYYSALRKAGVPVELHIYAKGPHGVGLCLDNPILGSWSDLLEGWLKTMGILA